MSHSGRWYVRSLLLLSCESSVAPVGVFQFQTWQNGTPRPRNVFATQIVTGGLWDPEGCPSNPKLMKTVLPTLLLELMATSALRLIASDAYSTHYCTSYEKVGWSLSVRCDMHLNLFIYKASLLGSCHHIYLLCFNGPLVLIIVQ